MMMIIILIISLDKLLQFRAKAHSQVCECVYMCLCVHMCVNTLREC